jgi:hypothetical protein
VCQRHFKFHIRSRPKLFAAASTRRRRKRASTRFFCKQTLTSQKKKLIFQIFFVNPAGEAFMYIMWKNQRCIFILSGLFWQRNRNALYFMRALYFVLCRTISRSKTGLSDDFTQYYFPITPPGYGYVGRGPKDLWESGFQVCENSFFLPAKF